MSADKHPPKPPPEKIAATDALLGSSLATLYTLVDVVNERASTPLLHRQWHDIPSDIARCLPPHMTVDDPLAQEVIAELRQQIDDELARRNSPRSST